ncbi:MAG: serine hydrolase [Puia sp.]|nr:serine hydrolase [Puia sp.]
MRPPPFFLPICCCIAIFCLPGLAIAQKHRNTPSDKGVSLDKDITAGDPFAGLDTSFARVLKDWHAAGFAVAVVRKNEVLYAKGFGYRDYENKLPVTPHTLFAIGSCTKAFTASLIGLLDKAAKVDIDKPVRDYLPALKFYNEKLDETVTLRDMMCHRTGLSRHDYVWYLFNTDSRDSMLQKIKYMEPHAGLREKWEYNNFMFFAQGAVIEKLSGRTWEENVSEKLFQPLGMTESDFSVKDMVKNGDASLGYTVKQDSLIKKRDYYEIRSMGPAGSINSNITDMSHWLITWINAGKYEGKEILPESYVSQAISSQMAMGGGLPSKETPDIYFSGYGFGWFLSSYRGHYRVEHGGNIDGFSASTCFFPSDSIGIVVLSNQDASVVPSVVRDIIADRMLNLPYKDWNGELKARMEKMKLAAKEAKKNVLSGKKTGTHPSHALSDYTGFFSNPGTGSIEVSLRHDSLFAAAGNQIWWLRHYHYDVFEPFDQTKEGVDTAEGGEKLQFNTDLAGDIGSISIDMEPGSGAKPVVFSKGLKPQEIAKEGLQKYVGEYVLGQSLTLKVFIKGEKTLYLSVPGQSDYELVAVDTDRFSIKSLTGFTVQFHVDATGAVTELLSVQPNGTFKAVRKK